MLRFNTLPTQELTKPNTPLRLYSTAAPRRRCSETMAAHIASHAAVVAATALTVAAGSVAVLATRATPNELASVAVNFGRKGATNAGKEIAKGVTNAGKEIAKGATNAGTEVSKGIVLGAGEVAKGTVLGAVLGAGLLGAAMICSTIIISRTLERPPPRSTLARTTVLEAVP